METYKKLTPPEKRAALIEDENINTGNPVFKTHTVINGKS